MIITQKTHPVRSNNVRNQEQKFEIETNEGAITLLIDFLSRLYKNPRRTLMTEYVQNALDSHVMKGNVDRPIEITIPNKLNPHYVVRDYGVSMDKETIFGMFRKAFSSTKRGSNSERGGFGVGKLVFGPYSGVMYLTTFLDGVKSIYLCRLQDGDGGITEVHSEETSEENGVEVKIPVQEQDFTFFTEEAKWIYYFIKPTPIIKCQYGYQLRDEDNIIYDDEDITVLKNHITNRKTAVATIGSLPFTIDYTEMGYSSIWLDSFALHFDVGEIDHTPSRDALEYNEKTVTALKDKLESIKDRVIQHIVDKVDTFNHIYYAKKYLVEVSSKGNLVSKILAGRIEKNKITYKGNPIQLTPHRLNKYILEEKELHPNSGKLRHRTIGYLNIKSYDTKLFYYPENTELGQAQSSRRIKYYLENNNDPEVLVIPRSYSDKKDDIIKELEYPDELVVSIEDLPKPPKVVRSYSSGGSNVSNAIGGIYSKSKVFYLTTRNSSPYLRNTDWLETDIDLNHDHFVYCEINRYKPRDTKYQEIDIQRVVSEITKFHHNTFRLIGIKTTEVKKAKENPNAIHIDDYVRQIVESYATKYKILCATQEYFRYTYRKICYGSLKDCKDEKLNQLVKYIQPTNTYDRHKVADDLNRLCSFFSRVKLYPQSFLSYRDKIKKVSQEKLKKKEIAIRTLGAYFSKNYPLISKYSLNFQKNEIDYVNAMWYAREHNQI